MQKLTKFKEWRKRFGLYDTIIAGGLSVLGRALCFHKLEIVTIAPDKVNEEFLDLPDGLKGSFLKQSDFPSAFIEDPELNLPEDYFPEALRDQHRCYAIYKDEEIVSYGWYTRTPALITGNLKFVFDPDYVYMQRGYTKPDYRGMRLHAIGMTRALNETASEGRKGIVSFVKRENLPSLKSCYRMGYEKLGSVFFLSVFGKALVWKTSGCDRASVTLAVDEAEPVAPQQYQF